MMFCLLLPGFRLW